MDAFTHSLAAFRLTPGSDSSIEVAMLLRDVMLPLPMRPDWTPDMEWHYPGVPAALVTEFAGHPVAGRPFFAPETVTSDHGSVYKNHHLVQVARTLGVVVLPARAMRPQDKAACERAFSGVQSLLLEMLLGYRGVDVADRGADPEGDAVWTVDEMERLLAMVGRVISCPKRSVSGRWHSGQRCSRKRWWCAQAKTTGSLQSVFQGPPWSVCDGVPSPVRQSGQ